MKTGWYAKQNTELQPASGQEHLVVSVSTLQKRISDMISKRVMQCRHTTTAVAGQEYSRYRAFREKLVTTEAETENQTLARRDSESKNKPHLEGDARDQGGDESSFSYWGVCRVKTGWCAKQNTELQPASGQEHLVVSVSTLQKRIPDMISKCVMQCRHTTTAVSSQEYSR
jgi:hypothetical protein